MLHNFRNNNVKSKGFDDGHPKSAWNGGDKSSYGGSSRYTESAGGKDFEGGKMNFFNSNKHEGKYGDITPHSDKGDGKQFGFTSPVLHNFRNNSKNEEADAKKYSQTPNPGYEDSSRRISSMAEKKSSLKTNSNPFYQTGGDGPKAKNDGYYGNEGNDTHHHPSDSYNNRTDVESPNSHTSPFQKSTPASTGRQFGKKL